MFLSGVFAINGLEAFVDFAIAIIVDVITALRCRVIGTTDHTAYRQTALYALTASMFVSDAARLPMADLFVNLAVAIIVDSVADFVGWIRGTTLGPPPVVTELITIARADLITLFAGSDLADGFLTAFAASVLGKAYEYRLV